MKKQTVSRIPFKPYDITKALGLWQSIGLSKGDFVIDKRNEFLYTNLIRWIYNDPNFMCYNLFDNKVVKGNPNKGVFISGKTGVGKTWAMSIFSSFCTSVDSRIIINGKIHFLDITTIKSSKIVEGYTNTGFIDCVKCPILCIDDIGAEPTESIFMGNRINVIKTILEERADNPYSLTFLTSNLSMKEIDGYYGDRVASRLKSMCNYFELRGEDRRKL